MELSRAEALRRPRISEIYTQVADAEVVTTKQIQQTQQVCTSNTYKLCDELIEKVRAGIPNMTAHDATEIFAVLMDRLTSLEAVQVTKSHNQLSPQPTEDIIDFGNMAITTIDNALLGDGSISRPSNAIERDK